jgi:hypothetical protein
VFAVEADVVKLRNVYTFEESRIVGVDVLVPWRGNEVVEQLSPAVRATGIEVHTVGDCVAPRTADIAFAEGALIARQI